MDPADRDAFRHAITQQGALLGQHDSALQSVSTSLAEISAVLAALQCQPPHQPPVDPGPTPGPPLHQREPHVPAPERYNGDLGSCRAFLVQCSVVFEQQPTTYATDRSRIAYLLGSLKGDALAWASALWERQGEACFSYDDFTGEMRKVFDHPVRGKDAAKRLLSLRQGSRSVATLAIEFRTLATESGWNDEALQGAFQNALCESIKDELALRDEPESLDQLIALAIRLDNRQRERRRERSSRSQSGYACTPPVQGSPPRAVEPPQARRSGPEAPEPMQVGRARLTPEERARRMSSRACMYCGQPGHFVSTCPLCP